MIKLLIATHNPGKLAEYKQLLSSTTIELLSLDDIGITEEVDETGVSFRQNSYLKAKSYSILSGVITLSDDSGLQVDHLGGDPGIYSARYGGELCKNDSDSSAFNCSTFALGIMFSIGRCASIAAIISSFVGGALFEIEACISLDIESSWLAGC